MTAKLLSQIENWRRQLLDLSKRNRLISCPVGTRGFVEPVHPDPEAIWMQIGVGNGTMQFVWKRDLFDEAEVEECEPEVPASETDVPGGENVLTIKISLSTGESVDISGNGTAKKEPPEKTYPLEDCRQSPRLTKNHLLTNLTDKTLATRLNRLAWASGTSLTEQGINIL